MIHATASVLEALPVMALALAIVCVPLLGDGTPRRRDRDRGPH